jgi:hypothetical protein
MKPIECWVQIDQNKLWDVSRWEPHIEQLKKWGYTVFKVVIIAKTDYLSMQKRIKALRTENGGLRTERGNLPACSVKRCERRRT